MMFKKLCRKIRWELIELDEQREDIIRFMSDEEFEEYQNNFVKKIFVSIKALKDYIRLNLYYFVK